MSNHNKPQFRLPGSTPGSTPGGAPPAPLSPPPTTLASDFAELLERFPLPWCVGPHGDIWVAADVEEIDRGLDGFPRWRATGDKARLVMENPAGVGIAALIVHAVNKLNSGG